MRHVYFVQADHNGPVKIGISSNFKQRIRDLQSMCPYAVRVLATKDGQQRHELWLHRKFKSSRLKGEWFAPTEELFTFISELKKKTFEWPEADVAFESLCKETKLSRIILRGRRKRKLTLRVVSKQTGISNVMISQIERGRIKEPSWRNIVSLSNALGLSLKRLAATE